MRARSTGGCSQPLTAPDSDPGPAAPPPRQTIVFVTKRPGGYDVLLEALARQTSKEYELLCIDELAHRRSHKVRKACVC